MLGRGRTPTPLNSPKRTLARQRTVLSVLAAGALLTATACGSPGTGSAGTSESAVDIGLLTSITGALASTFGPDVEAGFKARVSAENDAGGVHGRKINVHVADDTSTPAGNVTAVQSLVRDDVLAVGSWSAYMFAGYRPLNQNGIPLVGGAFGAPQFGDPSLTNQFSVNGPLDPDYTPYDSFGKLLKAQGVTKMAAITYGTVPSAKSSTDSFKASAKAAGIEICYENYNVPPGGVDFTPIALAVKNAGCDGVGGAMVLSSQLALAQALRDAGVAVKGQFSTQGYEQHTLNTPQVLAAAQGVTFITPLSPVDDPNPGTKVMLDQLERYAHSTGIPSFGEFGGWLTADAIITGLKGAGPNPTRESFQNALRRITDYTAGGVLAGPTDFSLAAIGHGDSTMSGSKCWFAQRLTGSKFESVSGSTPFCGQPLPAGSR